MQVLEIDQLPKFLLPQHSGHYSQEVRGPNTGNSALSILFCGMNADGGAEMHTHDVQEHIFFVLEGELQIDDGEQIHVIPAGQAAIVEPGNAHQVTGTRRGIDCKYIVVTIPPAWTK